MNARKGQVQLPRNNQIFMLSFVGCNDNHIAPCDNEQHKYAKVGYSEYAGDGMYITKGMYVAKGKYSAYAKDSMYVAKGEYGKHAKEATFV